MDKDYFPGSSYKRNVKKMIKQGRDIDLLEDIILKLYFDEPLDEKHRDHALIAKGEGVRELHILPDWLLVYENSAQVLMLHATGSHSELRLA